MATVAIPSYDSMLARSVLDISLSVAVWPRRFYGGFEGVLVRVASDGDENGNILRYSDVMSAAH